jgi:hypothetical protein
VWSALIFSATRAAFSTASRATKFADEPLGVLLCLGCCCHPLALCNGFGSQERRERLAVCEHALVERLVRRAAVPGMFR